MVRTRIAPSPTGFPHIGTISQALINYAVAKNANGKFIVRIEDTDRARYVEGAEDGIFEALDWFGLTPDESVRNPNPSYEPYRQSDKQKRGDYQKYAEKLIESGYAYYCFCTPEDLDAMRKEQQAAGKIPMYNGKCRALNIEESKRRVKNEPHVIRMYIKPADDKPEIEINDDIRGVIKFKKELVDDQVIIKSDGFPTYHLAVVIDDHDMEISHVIRGEEWISSTPKHVLLYQYFGWNPPSFLHTPLLRNPDGSKLSKRHGHSAVSWYKENGFLPEAILNYLANLVYSHPKGEIFTLQEFIDAFIDRTKMHAVGAKFDLQKLTWMNQQYIMKMSDDELFTKLKKFYSDVVLSETKDPQQEDKKILRLSPQNDNVMKQLLPLVRERLQTLKDFEALAGHFFVEPEINMRNEAEKKVAKELSERLEKITVWDKDTIFATFKEVMTACSVRMPVLYYVLTGSERGLPLPESIAILGKEKTLSRLNHLLQ